MSCTKLYYFRFYHSSSKSTSRSINAEDIEIAVQAASKDENSRNRISEKNNGCAEDSTSDTLERKTDNADDTLDVCGASESDTLTHVDSKVSYAVKWKKFLKSVFIFVWFL